MREASRDIERSIRRRHRHLVDLPWTPAYHLFMSCQTRQEIAPAVPADNRHRLRINDGDGSTRDPGRAKGERLSDGVGEG